MNRYYSNSLGRFTSPDPYIASGGPADPQSWNRYTYTTGDPLNWFDPGGLVNCNPGDRLPCVLNDGGINPNIAPSVGGSGGKDWNPLDRKGRGPGTSPWLKVWSALSPECQQGLREAMPNTGIQQMTAALNRAVVASTILRTAVGSAVPWEWVAAIGIRETAFVDRYQKGSDIPDGKNCGVGVFQIDICQNRFVSQGRALGLSYSAGWAGRALDNNLTSLEHDLPKLTGDDLLRAVLASWNSGVGGVESVLKAGLGVDSRTTGLDCGWDVFDLLKCFH